jgi:hypothetical protein
VTHLLHIGARARNTYHVGIPVPDLFLFPKEPRGETGALIKKIKPHDNLIQTFYLLPSKIEQASKCLEISKSGLKEKVSCLNAGLNALLYGHPYEESTVLNYLESRRQDISRSG